MKGNITITIFEPENLGKVIEFCDLHIVAEKRSVGIHKNATREHVHIGLTGLELPTVKDIRKYYNRKGVKDCLLNPKNIKFSVYADTDPEKDDMKCLAYPLKEYGSFQEIKYRDYIIGISDDELEKLRVYSNTRYLAIKHNQDRVEQKKEESTKRQLQLDDYLKSKIWENFYISIDANHPEYVCIKPEYENIALGYCKIFEWACEYNADYEEKLSWRWNDISNHVYSLMFRERLYKPFEIITFQQKIKYTPNV